MIKRCLIALLAVGLIGCAETYEKVEIKHENASVLHAYYLCSETTLFHRSLSNPMDWNTNWYPAFANLFESHSLHPINKQCVLGRINWEDRLKKIIVFENVSKNKNFLLVIPKTPNKERQPWQYTEVAIYKIDLFSTSMNTSDFEVIIKDVEHDR